jgi:hypothetical protein
MSLSPDEIQKILATPQAQPRVKKPKIDPNIRDYSTWFKMRHLLLVPDTEETANCSNPHCPKEGHMVAEVSGVLMCRSCFLLGYGLVEEGQGVIDGV